MKEEISFEFSSDFFIEDFFTAHELVKIMKVVGLDSNIKLEGEDYSLKEWSRVVSR